MADSWQTIPVKHRKWVHNDSVSGSGSGSAQEPGRTRSSFRSEQTDSVSFSSFGSRPSNRETNAAFANKRAGRDSRRDQDGRMQAHARMEFEARRAHEEEITLKEALTIESEKEYPSLQSSCSGSPKKSSSLLNFKAMVEAPATPNVPKITVIGGAKPGVRPSSPKYRNDYEYEEEEYEEFNAHIGRRGDAW